MAANSIPNEIWMTIFELATADEYNYDILHTSMATSSWFKNVFNKWSLQSPEELSANAQRRRYKAIKAILRTCKNWHLIAREFLYKNVSIFESAELHKLCAAFDRESTLGWWTKRIYVGDSVKGDALDALVTIIRHCPNIETLIVTWPLSSTYSAAIADTLLSFTSKSLRTLSWAISSAALPKTIWALNSFSKSLQSLHLQFEDVDVDIIVHLGSAADLNLTLPRLTRLSLRGAFQLFLEQCSEWSMPSLDHVTFDFVNAREDLPDVIEFLVRHGANLTFLDLNCLQTLDVARILDLCPELKTFTFNPDWRLPTDEFSNFTKLVNRPHRTITHIGLQQLMYAFGVGYAATYTEMDPYSTRYIRTSNDLNFAALTKENFPSLQCVRVLNRALLSELDEADGPSEECLPRWERWWDQCAKQGVRLEDCTGASLGTLPLDDSDEEESDEEESSDEDDEEEEYVDSESDAQVGGGGASLMELRQLLAECRRMSLADQDDTNFLNIQLESRF